MPCKGLGATSCKGVAWAAVLRTVRLSRSILWKVASKVLNFRSLYCHAAVLPCLASCEHPLPDFLRTTNDSLILRGIRGYQVQEVLRSTFSTKVRDVAFLAAG
jgi:hypothetical protein